jgi:hypothetical protein
MFETNDDVLMNLIAAGQVVSNAPDEHILFSHVLIGMLRKLVYRQAPGAAWYGWYEIAALLAASVAAAYAILRAGRGLAQLVFAASFLGVIALPCLLYLQFTKTAFLLSLAGVLLAISIALEAPPRPRIALPSAAVCCWPARSCDSSRSHCPA